MMKTRPIKALLALVLAVAFFPALFALRPPDVKLQSVGAVEISLSGGTLVPIVIAASFTRITDADNNLVCRTTSDMDGDSRAVSTRESIFSMIENNPGIHFRDICRRLEKEIGVVQYHVYILKKFGLVTSERDGRFTRFYAKSARYDEISRSILASWQRPVEKVILSKLVLGGAQQQPGFMKDVMASCSVTSQAVTWHLNRLKTNGLLESNDLSSPVLVDGVQEKMLLLARHGVINIAG